MNTLPIPPSGLGAEATYHRKMHEAVRSNRLSNLGAAKVSYFPGETVVHATPPARRTRASESLPRFKIKVCLNIDGEDQEVYMWINSSGFTYDDDGYIDPPVVEGTPPTA